MALSADELNVSRETFERLEIYVSLVEKWTSKINLIAKSTIPHIWSRHIMDSVQLCKAGPDSFDLWVDMGSGAGFPGIVAAIMAQDSSSQKTVTLVESDQRKAAFLRAALRETGVSGAVMPQRIEALTPQNANVVSARALADLTTLLSYADRHLANSGVALFSKGANWEKEVEDAKVAWSFSCVAVKSQTEEGAVMLRIGEITRV
ncbi:MAG: 16S rRNA (guanine(527)-N(7))-methyltransferase RsmG [Rhodobacterales bacterium]